MAVICHPNKVILTLPRMEVLWDGNRICKNKNTSHKYKYGMYKKKKKKIIYIYVCVCVCVCTFRLLEADSQKKKITRSWPISIYCFSK